MAIQVPSLPVSAFGNTSNAVMIVPKPKVTNRVQHIMRTQHPGAHQSYSPRAAYFLVVLHISYLGCTGRASDRWRSPTASTLVTGAFQRCTNLHGANPSSDLVFGGPHPRTDRRSSCWWNPRPNIAPARPTSSNTSYIRLWNSVTANVPPNSYNTRQYKCLGNSVTHVRRARTPLIHSSPSLQG